MPPQFTEYTLTRSPDTHRQPTLTFVRTRWTFTSLRKLKLNATGPDLIPARLLKECPTQLALPIALFARLTLRTSAWPQPWRLHWFHPLHKKKNSAPILTITVESTSHPSFQKSRNAFSTSPSPFSFPHSAPLQPCNGRSVNTTLRNRSPHS